MIEKAREIPTLEGPVGGTEHPVGRFVLGVRAHDVPQEFREHLEDVVRAAPRFLAALRDFAVQVFRGARARQILVEAAAEIVEELPKLFVGARGHLPAVDRKVAHGGMPGLCRRGRRGTAGRRCWRTDGLNGRLRRGRRRMGGGLGVRGDPFLNDAVHRFKEALHRNRLFQEVLGAELDGFHGRFNGAVPRHDDHGGGAQQIASHPLLE